MRSVMADWCLILHRATLKGQRSAHNLFVGRCDPVSLQILNALSFSCLQLVQMLLLDAFNVLLTRAESPAAKHGGKLRWQDGPLCCFGDAQLLDVLFVFLNVAKDGFCFRKDCNKICMVFMKVV